MERDKKCSRGYLPNEYRGTLLKNSIPKYFFLIFLNDILPVSLDTYNKI